MTHLATKNGSLIVKDGKIAEDCGCCGGWYCCSEPACAADTIASASVTIAATDYQKSNASSISLSGVGTCEYYWSYGFVGSRYNGTHTLDKTSATQWKHIFPAQPDSECVASLTLSVTPGNTTAFWSLVFAYPLVSYGWYYWSYYTSDYTRPPASSTLSSMKCRCLPGFDANGGFPVPAGYVPTNGNILVSDSKSLGGVTSQCSDIATSSTSFSAISGASSKFKFPPSYISSADGTSVGSDLVTMSLNITQQT